MAAAKVDAQADKQIAVAAAATAVVVADPAIATAAPVDAVASRRAAMTACARTWAMGRAVVVMGRVAAAVRHVTLVVEDTIAAAGRVLNIAMMAAAWPTNVCHSRAGLDSRCSAISCTCR